MAFPQNTADCIQHLYPDSKIDRDWVVTSKNSVIEIENWNTDIGMKPTEAEINAVSTTVEDQWTAHAYARKRATEYPSTGDQLDYIFHNGIAKWKTDMIAPVKAKYPKPA